MLVCNVSQLRRRAAIAAGLAEAATALDAPGTGNVVFATLVDDPASVGEHVDAFLGQIMLEAANASSTVTAGLAYAATIAEAVTAIDAASASRQVSAAVAEAATGADSPDATKMSSSLAISGTPVTTGTEYEHGVGSTYTGFTVTASGGSAPYTYSVASGTLPAGITLNSATGAVSGTPAFESAGVYSGIVIRVTDNVGATANLASFTLTIAFKDPYYANVNLLLDYDAANNSTVFTDQKSGSTMTAVGAVKHSTTVTPLYGTSTFLFGGTDILQLGDAPGWTIGSANFTLDFTARPTSVSGTKFWLAHWQTAPQLGWALYQFNDSVWLNVSTTGSNSISDLGSVAGTLAVNTWARWRVDFDGAKYRLYKNGVMIASSTTPRVIFDSNQNLAVGNSSTGGGPGIIGNCRGVRLTVGAARTASDSGYTISNRAFPTS
jgi:Putative Ig domain/Concanavalin A-like lectin/glucanases superfamily